MSSAKSLALVTGASHGIGRELAKQFAQNGFDLIVSGRGDLSEASSELSVLAEPGSNED
jgi:short-subunit dehydrogenase